MCLQLPECYAANYHLSPVLVWTQLSLVVWMVQVYSRGLRLFILSLGIWRLLSPWQVLLMPLLLAASRVMAVLVRMPLALVRMARRVMSAPHTLPWLIEVPPYPLILERKPGSWLISVAASQAVCLTDPRIITNTSSTRHLHPAEPQAACWHRVL